MDGCGCGAGRQRQRGIPTVFECAAPLGLIDEDFQDPLARTLTTLHFKERSKIPAEDGGADEWGFSISAPLPAKFILGHIHPAVVSDPLLHGGDFYSPTTTCGWCSPHSQTS
jgi:hypothetical protein